MVSFNSNMSISLYFKMKFVTQQLYTYTLIRHIIIIIDKISTYQYLFFLYWLPGTMEKTAIDLIKQIIYINIYDRSVTSKRRKRKAN
jgi:hypothetical protein